MPQGRYIKGAYFNVVYFSTELMPIEFNTTWRSFVSGSVHLVWWCDTQYVLQAAVRYGTEPAPVRPVVLV